MIASGFCRLRSEGLTRSRAAVNLCVARHLLAFCRSPTPTARGQGAFVLRLMGLIHQVVAQCKYLLGFTMYER